MNFYPHGLDENGIKKLFDPAIHSMISERIISLDWVLNGLYGHSGTSFVSIGRQVIVPNMALILPGATLIEAKFQFVYYTEGSATMDIRLLNYSTGVAVASSEENFPDVGVYTSAVLTNWVAVTEGDSYRIQTKRTGGVGADSVILEGVNLILKYTI